MKKQCKCGNDEYTLDIMDCDDCHNNGWYCKGEGYVYSEPPKGEYRSQAENEGECAMGHNWSFGCWLLTCTKCGKQIHIPLMEG